MKTSPHRLPNNFRKYFWDCKFEDLSFEKYNWFIAERLLNFGNQKAIKWLLSHTDVPFLKNIIEKSRQLDSKTRNFWKIILSEQ